MTLPTPDPAATPAPAPGRSRGRVVVTVVAIVVAIIVAVVVRVAIRAGVDHLMDNSPTLADYSVGKCIEEYTTGTSDVPRIVDCDDAKAKAKIVDSFAGRHFADGYTLCPGDAHYELSDSSGDTVLLCLQVP